MSRNGSSALTLRRADAIIGIAGALTMVLLAVGLALESALVSLIAGALMAGVIVVAGSVNLVPDDSRSQATERTLRVAANTLEHLHGGLTPQNAQAICTLLLPETNAVGVAITDAERVLAYEGSLAVAFQPGDANSRPTMEVLRSRRTETFYAMEQDMKRPRRLSAGARSDGASFGAVVPLVVQGESVGTIKLYYTRDRDMDRTQLAIARGLGQLLSTQLSAYKLDTQAELVARAEVKALQAQINPHFLFNTLNTIASLCRTDPMRARTVLREFSAFYRYTLESSESGLIPLSRELEQTRRYLVIEKARFGEDRIIEVEHVSAVVAQVMVPSFVVQPIVENAVRHAMRDSEPLHIDIHSGTDGDDVLIAVTDDGLGMTSEAAARLLDKDDEAAEPAPVGSGRKRGAGMALKNVMERLERFYGPGSGVEVVSKPGEGTCVTLRLSGAAKKLAQIGDEE
ncbi:histidine kinase [Paratractidigestivibacter sp.]|nr:histidine kinase [Paratractidigestivibacter sp.]